jgi:hypothetical protein
LNADNHTGAKSTIAMTKRFPPNSFEKAVIAALLILTIIGPPVLIEGFPLSAAPMFAMPCEQLWRYRLTDAAGQRLDNDVFGLRSNVCWYLEPYYAVKYPKNVVAPPMHAPDFTSVIEHIRQTGISNRSEFPLRLEAMLIGDINGCTVGERTKLIWNIASAP